MVANFGTYIPKFGTMVAKREIYELAASKQSGSLYVRQCERGRASLVCGQGRQEGTNVLDFREFPPVGTIAVGRGRGQAAGVRGRFCWTGQTRWSGERAWPRG